MAILAIWGRLYEPRQFSGSRLFDVRCLQAAVHSVGPGALCDYHFTKLHLDDSEQDDDGTFEDSSQGQSASQASETETTAETSDAGHDGQGTGIDLHDVDPRPRRRPRVSVLPHESRPQRLGHRRRR
ncbi:hypothetical protein [Haladaptatus halobius]|uniref:hypothetical protein n=1 Tax=Haladaptatus halobius TaxID=2884875 RepID=UPI001D0A183E|nr:hypothetical protein [Haladaptatus halobius]